MDQTTDLLQTLKRCLRAHRIGYRQVAAALDLSEASVKRLFSAGSFSMRRIEAVCRLMDMTLYDLTRLAQAHGGTDPRTLSLEQERALADDPRLLHCFYVLLNGWTAEQIQAEYTLTTPVLVKLLTTLDRLGLVELLPGNHVRLLTARNISWRPGGPVRIRYEQTLRALFLAEGKEAGSDAFRFASGELSEASMRIMQRRMDRLMQGFEELVELDTGLPPTEKENTGLMLAFRPWGMRLLDMPASGGPRGDRPDQGRDPG